MESNNAEAEMRTRVTTPVSRWSPTKEQISILENLYKQGIRTPNTDQIQQITCSLGVYGHIEGKNVFYWFQNHKARLRQKQKQKQQTAAYFNPFLHTSHPISSNPLCQKSVFCVPHCLEQSGIRFYPQQAKVAAAEGMTKMCDGPQQLQERETLTLFPLHPTGILEGKTSSLHTTSDVRK